MLMLALTTALAKAPPAALFSDDGWGPYNERRGVTVQSKPIDGVGTAFRGIYPLPADCDPEDLFAVINDIEGALHIGGRLDESRVLKQSSTEMHYYQVLSDPIGPVAARWWLNHATIERDVDGEAQHFRRTWRSAPDDAYPDTRADLATRYPNAIEVGGTWGAWEIDPEGPTLIYTTITLPGGNVPSGVYTAVSGRTLPDNMLDFVDVARAR